MQGGAGVCMQVQPAAMRTWHLHAWDCGRASGHEGSSKGGLQPGRHQAPLGRRERRLELRKECSALTAGERRPAGGSLRLCRQRRRGMGYLSCGMAACCSMPRRRVRQQPCTRLPACQSVPPVRTGAGRSRGAAAWRPCACRGGRDEERGGWRLARLAWGPVNAAASQLGAG